MFALTPFAQRRLSPAHGHVARNIDELFDRFLWPQNSAGAANFRDFDMYEKDGKLCLSIEAPGVNPDELEIKTSRDRVSIRSKQEADEKDGASDSGRTWYNRKSVYSFNYEVSLPFEIDTDKAEAAFENGVINIMAPRLQASESKVLTLKKA
ncbi:MAG: Hsp20/alpha crystallin family protein [Synergistaceae bacterium]|jgi:HSP20 family protein|nr:Hsp20/alpha crystallin family protein [Synergistaceae bacterium]